MYIRTVSYLRLLSTLHNQFKLIVIHEPFGQSKVHSTVYYRYLAISLKIILQTLYKSFYSLFQHNIIRVKPKYNFAKTLISGWFAHLRDTHADHKIGKMLQIQGEEKEKLVLQSKHKCPLESCNETFTGDYSLLLCHDEFS